MNPFGFIFLYITFPFYILTHSSVNIFPWFLKSLLFALILKAPSGSGVFYFGRLDVSSEPDTGVKADGEAVFVVLLAR